MGAIGRMDQKGETGDQGTGGGGGADREDGAGEGKLTMRVPSGDDLDHINRVLFNILGS